MASENREKALKLFLDYKGDITNRKIAEILGEKEKTISAWKSRGKWKEVLQNGGCSTTDNSVVLQGEQRSTTKRGAPLGNKNAVGHGAPRGNKNALGNSGGGAMPGNKNAEKHGFFARILPDDDETREIIESIDLKSPLEILWENIVLQYGIIARAQRIMYVRNQDDLTKVLKRQKESESATGESWEKEYELQFAWDKQATLLKAQSAAMRELKSLIAQYDEMSGNKRKLELDKMRAEIAKIKDSGGNKSTPVNVVFNIPRPPKEGGANA